MQSSLAADQKGAEAAWQKRVNIALLCMYAIIEGMDMALLPASMRGLEVSLGFGPSRVAALAATQGIMSAFAGPFWAALSDNGYPKRKLLAGGAASWTLILTLLALVSDFRVMLFLRALNGIILAIMVPVSQSMVVEVAGPEERGRLFGITMFCQMTLGMMPAMAIGTGLSTQMVWGFAGWRLSLVIVAALGALVSPLVWFFMVEEPREWRPERINVAAELEKFAVFLTIPSFCVIVGQGMFNAITMCTFQFLTLHFQYQGFADYLSGLLCAIVLISCGFGFFFGGIFGDWSARLSPDHGRAYIAQVSTFMQMLLIYVLFQVEPGVGIPGEMNLCLVLVLVFLGAFSWSKSGCNRPILSELVTGEGIGSIMAWNNCFEYGAGMLIGPSTIGILAQGFFGYEVRMEPVAEMPLDVRERNASAMANAMLLVATLPQIMVILIYVLLHYTYAADAEKVRQALEKKGANEKTPIL